jgi:hypothetical protein
MHLVLTVFRHSRGILNAVEKFERTIPREHRASEVSTLVQFARAAVVAAEQTLTTAQTD